MQQMIRSLQIILHLAMNSVVFPAITMISYSALMEVAMYDVLGEERICTNCNLDTWLEYDSEKIDQSQDLIME